MATAYGGVAKPRIRKVGQKFANITRIDRAGLQTSQGPSRPGNPKMHNLTSARPTFAETGDITAASNQINTKMSNSKHGGLTVGGTTERTLAQTKGLSQTGARMNTTSGW